VKPLESVKLAIFDVDGTLAPDFYLLRLAEYLFEFGLFSSEAAKRIHSCRDELEEKRDYIKFADDVVKEYARGIKGKSQKQILRAAEEYLQSKPNMDLFGFSRNLVSLIQRKNFKTLFISGSPLEIIRPLADNLLVKDVRATEFDVDNNHIFTGDVRINCALPDPKRKSFDLYINHLRENTIVDMEKSIGFGDSGSDLSFLDQVGYAVAIYPRPEFEVVVAEKKKNEKKWLIYRQSDTNVVKLVEDHLRESL
jgi:HAD superfamily phosphoserine phosphatase-like hydrolase